MCRHIRCFPIFIPLRRFLHVPVELNHNPIPLVFLGFSFKHQNQFPSDNIPFPCYFHAPVQSYRLPVPLYFLGFYFNRQFRISGSLCEVWDDTRVTKWCDSGFLDFCFNNQNWLINCLRNFFRVEGLPRIVSMASFVLYFTISAILVDTCVKFGSICGFPNIFPFFSRLSLLNYFP